jgi:predicted Zn-dependent protease
MKELFFDLADFAVTRLRGNEVLLANFSGEESDFVRFNRGRVRQPMSVQQASLSLALIDGKRHDCTTLALASDGEQDRAAIAQAIETMRSDLPSLPEDPYLLYSTEPKSSESVRRGRLPTPAQAIDDVVRAASDLDLVGILGSGPVYRGFANSFGQRNWHAVDSFLFDWSVYHATDKAVKCNYAGAEWNGAEVVRRINAAREQLAHLAKPARTIEPGEYRAYLTPAALDELLWLLNWGGVSAKEQRTQQSVLQHLVDGETQLSPQITLREHTAQGLAPAFDDAGFARPDAIELIRAGRHAGSLVSPRTAQEYGLPPNGADEGESMQSMELAVGELPQADALATLDDGIYVGNFHYLNFSDRPSCRVTGLTRFATFWVEKGRIAAPLNVMRFDDTLYRMLGSRLENLTRESEWILNAGTYGQRSVETSRVPGALLAALTLTL